jgi:hypothetical protein
VEMQRKKIVGRVIKEWTEVWRQYI